MHCVLVSVVVAVVSGVLGYAFRGKIHTEISTASAYAKKKI